MQDQSQTSTQPKFNRALRRGLQIGAVLGMAALAGCAGTPPEEPDPQMGPALIDPVEAGRMLGNICADNLPNFEGSPAAIARYPMVLSTTTGLYVHREARLQVGLAEGECFILFQAIDAEQQVVLAVDDGLVEQGYTDLSFTYTVTDVNEPGMAGYAFILASQ